MTTANIKGRSFYASNDSATPHFTLCGLNDALIAFGHIQPLRKSMKTHANIRKLPLYRQLFILIMMIFAFIHFNLPHTVFIRL
jgi:hypothetical protein